MDIAMLYLNKPAFVLETPDIRGLGGSESGFCRTAKCLSAMGHKVSVFNQSEMTVDYGENLHWSNISHFDRNKYYDIIYSLRHLEPFDEKLNTKLRVLFLADTECVGLGPKYIHQAKIDLVMAVSNWQKEKIAKEEEIHDDYWMVTSNGIDSCPVDYAKKVRGRCLFMGTPERGLQNIVEIWPKIKEKVPYASLHLYSSFMGWGIAREENLQFGNGWLQELYDKIKSLAPLDVVNFEHVDAGEIRKAQLEADLYLYPSDFYETCCMSVLESMYCGTIPVTSCRAALMEKVIPGVTGRIIPTYGSSSDRYRDLFIDQVIRQFQMSDEESLQMRKNCHTYASHFTYDVLVPQWVDEWKRRIK